MTVAADTTGWRACAHCGTKQPKSVESVVVDGSRIDLCAFHIAQLPPAPKPKRKSRKARK